MTTVRLVCGAAFVSLLFLGSQTLQSQTKGPQPPKGASAGSQNKEPNKAGAAEKGRGRLPNRYAQIGLSDAQKEQVYAIQAKYRAEIKEIQKKLAALRAGRDKEIEGMLTEDQKKRLAELVAQSKAAGDRAEQPAPAGKTTDKKENE